MKIWLKISFLLIAFVPCTVSAQIKPRVAGLGSNAEYMELLAEEQKLVQKEDSLTRVITQVREEFRANPGEREKYANEILKLEEQIFEVKNQTGIIAGKLSGIEEQFILTSMQGGKPLGGDTQQTTRPGAQSPMLVANAVFSEKLPPDDYQALLRAQRLEKVAADLLVRYFQNYDNIIALGPDYEQAKDAAVADSIYACYAALDERNAQTADSLGSVWGEIFDNKTFAYNYLLETGNELRLLARFEAAARDARDEIARQRDEAASEKVLAYLYQKSLVLDYEKTLARLFSLTAAADSLKKVDDVFQLMKRPLPDISYEERIFIDYEDISAHSPARYNSSNPIPEVAVYKRGIVYRILVGTYTQRQAISAFRGLYPLGYERREDGKWAYYAGAYRTLDEADAGLEAVKKRGFRNAAITVWNNGEANTLSTTELKRGDKTVTYRLEISGIQDAVPEPIVDIIRGIDDTVDITRPGELFLVGPYSTSFTAEKTAAAIRATDSGIHVRIIENIP